MHAAGVDELTRGHLDVGAADARAAAAYEDVVGAAGGRLDVTVDDVMRSLDDDRLHGLSLWGS